MEIGNGGTPGDGGTESPGTQGELPGMVAEPPAGVEQPAEPSADEPARDRSNIVVARGTADGLVLRLDGRVDSKTLHGALVEFLEQRRGFLAGNEISIEWVGQRPEDLIVTGLEKLLLEQFGVSLKSTRSVRDDSVPRLETVRNARRAQRADDDDDEDDSDVPDFFSGMEEFGLGTSGARERAAEGKRPAAAPMWDEADARVVYGTLRSGQRIESEHSVIVFGDVNSGAEVVAGGDVIVLGALRGIAHAGAYDETGGGRVIFGLNLQPTQLRIGSVISRGSSTGAPGLTAEIARVEGTIIVVEQYQSKATVSGRR